METKHDIINKLYKDVHSVEDGANTLHLPLNNTTPIYQQSNYLATKCEHVVSARTNKSSRTNKRHHHRLLFAHWYIYTCICTHTHTYIYIYICSIYVPIANVPSPSCCNAKMAAWKRMPVPMDWR